MAAKISPLEDRLAAADRSRDNDIIERCAKVAESAKIDSSYSPFIARCIADDIRKLKRN